jgi:hypothetical protein
MQRDQILALILDCITQGKATELAILSEAQAQGITPDDINHYLDVCLHQFGWIYALEPISARDRACYGITSAGRKSRAVMGTPGDEPVPPPVTKYRVGRSSLVEIQNGCRIDYFYGCAHDE